MFRIRGCVKCGHWTSHPCDSRSNCTQARLDLTHLLCIVLFHQMFACVYSSMCMCMCPSHVEFLNTTAAAYLYAIPSVIYVQQTHRVYSLLQCFPTSGFNRRSLLIYISRRIWNIFQCKIKHNFKASWPYLLQQPLWDNIDSTRSWLNM